ncbi:conserved exported hypothetical protein [[Clostridium] ultunense Esp]|uniref:putative glycoside hydrolase n=1 Tax=Thermicanus aegyptius TaxID=94009 RepID=UPI0002B6FF06|nr:putative glycoside hydrolase [Thermicanus aegyptius]CCQ96566.1 conserved exported hypothetical protein [[Clostridium] ultunense Esp]
MKRRFGRIFFPPVLIFFLFSSSFFIGNPLFAEGNGESPVEGKGYTSAEWQDALRSPSPMEVKRMKIPYKVKGVYMTGWSAGGEKFQKIVDLLDRSELNAVVIDVKEDKGDITYRSNIPLVHEIKSDHTRYIQDIDHVLEVLHEKNIYTIARIVSFKDPYMAGAKQEWSLQKKTGGVWKDRKGIMWVDPYRKEQWDYNLSVAIEAAKKGFDEIQLDYVRFPENGKKVDAEVSYYNPQGRTKEVLIRDFIRYVRENLKPYPVFLSADVFGLVPSVSDDMGIGQRWELITPEVDYISPMAYPSHYAKYTFGIAVPDAHPYEVIRGTILDAQKKDAALHAQGIKTATIRPWYQDFTASYLPKGEWIRYTGIQVLDQVRAGKELGIDSFLLWDPRNNFSIDAWIKS